MKILIATVKDWNIKNTESFIDRYKDIADIHFVTVKDYLILQSAQYEPDYIFFPHWSWKIPPEIYNNFNCIGFHCTDLPFGRGGSPLQNLIRRRIYKTKITAFQITDEMDAGPIYLKKDFDISEGSAEQLYKQMSDIIFFTMIPEILINKPLPKPQTGEVIDFKRRHLIESHLIYANDNYYDFIRMLDAPGYPKAYIQFGDYKFTFSNIEKIANGKLRGTFEITKNSNHSSSPG